MIIKDECAKCNSKFEVNALPSNAGTIYVMWINAHRQCRGDTTMYEVKD